ncbi:MAG: DUF5050 domain-containing protein [Lachnospiraceae bacterium]|nr:DUF5050 domain-containing protein [Lachnospiraceae bacterium]
MKKSNIIFIAILLFAIIGFIVASSILSHTEPLPDNATGNTAGNLYNNGYFAENEGVVYFANPSDDYHLYSMNPDESNLKKLNENCISLISAAGDYIFYYQSSLGGSNLGFLGHNTGVYRSRKNGKNTLCLVRDPVASLNLVGNDIYYEDFNEKKGLQINRISIDKKSQEILSDRVFDCSMYYASYFYYAGIEEDHNLHTFNIQSKTIGTVFEGNISLPIIDSGNIYYLNNKDNYCLYARPMNGDASTEVKLTEERVECYNIVNSNFIYYQTSTDSPALMRMRLNGSSKEMVANGMFTDINSTSRFVYFRLWDNNNVIFYHQDLSNGAVEQWTPPALEK